MPVVNNGPGYIGMHDQLPIDACQYNHQLEPILTGRDIYVEGNICQKELQITTTESRPV